MECHLLAGALASKPPEQLSPSDWAKAFREATASISHYSGAIAGDRTMMDALLPAAEAALNSAQSGEDPHLLQSPNPQGGHISLLLTSFQYGSTKGMHKAQGHFCCHMES